MTFSRAAALQMDDQAIEALHELARVSNGKAREIITLLPAEETVFEGIGIERIYEVADIIEQHVLESKPAGTWWTISAIARKGHLTPQETGPALRWMLKHQFIISNGRGGCWVNYG